MAFAFCWQAKSYLTIEKVCEVRTPFMFIVQRYVPEGRPSMLIGTMFTPLSSETVNTGIIDDPNMECISNLASPGIKLMILAWILSVAGFGMIDCNPRVLSLMIPSSSTDTGTSLTFIVSELIVSQRSLMIHQYAPVSEMVTLFL